MLACWAPTELKGPLLTGQFGGRMLGLVATDTAAHFQFVCGAGVTGPLRLQDGGTYRASGQAFGWWVPTLPIDVTAALSGNTLYVIIVTTVRTPDSTFAQTEFYQLSRGGTPDFSGYYCLADREPGGAD